jgi:hypothetical protein
MDRQPKRGQWVSGELPTRAPARRRPPSPPAVHGVLAERVQRVRQQALIGRPLSTVLNATAKTRQPSPLMILLSISSVAVLVLAAFSTQPLLISAAGLAALGTALALWHQRRSSPPSSLLDIHGHLTRDASQLDEYLKKISGELPPTALTTIAQIKETFRRLLSHLPSEGDSNIDLPGEDMFFINQLVSRYLPDACRHYLEARQGIIHSRDGMPESLDDSLNRQLAILQERLLKTLQVISEQHAQALSRHETFLNGKRNRA